MKPIAALRHGCCGDPRSRKGEAVASPRDAASFLEAGRDWCWACVVCVRVGGADKYKHSPSWFTILPCLACSSRLAAREEALGLHWPETLFYVLPRVGLGDLPGAGGGLTMGADLLEFLNRIFASELKPPMPITLLSRFSSQGCSHHRGDSLLHLELVPAAGSLQLSPWQPSQRNYGDGRSHGSPRQGHARGSRGRLRTPLPTERAGTLLPQNRMKQLTADK